MHITKIAACVFAAALGAATFMAPGQAKSDTQWTGGGTSAVYKNVPPDQIEFLSTPDRIISSTTSGSASQIWETLEHAEAVECGSCIGAVEPLLYNNDKEIREISAWWLRRRTFGVFGPGEVYERTVKTLGTDPNPQKRAYAAYALGEFLTSAGVEPLAAAATGDASPEVRAAAVSGLGRINDDGGGAIGKAMADTDASVRLSAIKAAAKVNGFNDSGAVAKLMGDTSPLVRKNGIELLESFRVKDAVQSLIAIARNDTDADVRLAACHALGVLGDNSARSTLEAILQTDSSSLVRDQAQIALRRI
jgi:HEAT repeat protein